MQIANMVGMSELFETAIVKTTFFHHDFLAACTYHGDSLSCSTVVCTGTNDHFLMMPLMPFALFCINSSGSLTVEVPVCDPQYWPRHWLRSLLVVEDCPAVRALLPESLITVSPAP